MSEKTADVGHRVAWSNPYDRAGVRMHSIARCVAAAFAIASCAGVAQAGPVSGSATTYQGRLVDDGTPIDGIADISVSVWDTESGGNQIGSTLNFPGTPFADGLFALELDFGAEVFDDDRWLEISVDGSTLSPRQKLTAAPYAVQTRGLFVDNLENVGIGTNMPMTRLQVDAELGIEPLIGQIHIEGNGQDFVGDAYISFAEGAEASYWSVGSRDVGNCFGISNSLDIDENTYFVIQQESGEVGINIINPLARLHVVESNLVTPVIRAVHTATDPGTALVISAENNTTQSTVIRADAEAPTGFNIGIIGSVESPDGFGIAGLAQSGSNGSGAAISGSTNNGNGIAIRGFMNQSVGSGYAIWGDANGGTNNYGVFSNGNLGASGAKTFRIDHPLDPENLYLQHYSAEAPEPTNVYSGNAVLGADGSAWITLPGYYDAINTDERYVLTAIGAPAPNLHVAQEVINNAFRVAGGSPGMKVSWQVTATRNDPFMRVQGVQDVIVKPAHEAGTYLQPALYGQPASKAMVKQHPAIPNSVDATQTDLLDAADNR